MTGRRILVVDDDQGMVDSLCDILELHGWNPSRAYDGVEAVAFSEEQDVDVVLMDVRMPRMNGVDALRLIKARRPDLAVVLVTAMADPELLDRAERDGALRILRKPLDVPQLLDLLAHAVE